MTQEGYMTDGKDSSVPNSKQLQELAELRRENAELKRQLQERDRPRPQRRRHPLGRIYYVQHGLGFGN